MSNASGQLGAFTFADLGLATFGPVGAGTGALATGTNSTAAGSGSVASGNNATALGQGSLASGANSLALGQSSAATGTNAIAIGVGATATGSVAMGAMASAGSGGTALGDFTTATGANSAAVGTGATATQANAAAFGTGATTTRANQQAFGTTTNTYTMAGVNSDASRAAQGAPAYIVTSNASGDLAGRTPAELGLASQSDLNRAFKKIDENTQGIAIAMAMGGLSLPAGKTFAVAANFGFYDDKQALAVQSALKLGETLTLNGGFGAGLNGVNGFSDATKFGGRVGLTAAW